MILHLSAACGLTLALGALSHMTLPAGGGGEREFGSVHWGRKLEPALLRAAVSKKPVMLLFQEVPG